jgi:acetyl esterase/lipase
MPEKGNDDREKTFVRGTKAMKDGRVWSIALCAVFLSVSGLGAAVGKGRGQQEKGKAGAPSGVGPGAIEKAGKGKTAEDWTTLPVRSTSLVMKRPEKAEEDDIPNTGYLRERLQVSWREGDPFDLYVIRPRGVEKPPVILYLYSFAEDTEQFRNSNWCETVVRGGYAAVGFVGAVTGHRTRYRLPNEWFVSEMPEALGATTHDVQLILDYLTQRGDLDMNRVAMFGSGSGGAIAVLASAVDPRIQVVDLLAPWGDWPIWLSGTKVLKDDERAGYTKAEFLGKVAPLDPVDWIGKMRARSVRIQDIRGNRAMPDQAQQELEARAPDTAEIFQFGNGRAFLRAQPALTLFDWVKGQLQTRGQPQIAREKKERTHVYPAVQANDAGRPNAGRSTTNEKPETGATEEPQ